jgi:outer membrane receptor protein involved in Fe transport
MDDVVTRTQALAARIPASVLAILVTLGLLVTLAPVPAAGQSDTGTVVGRVTSESGDPLGAVTVRALGTDRSTITDPEGQYRLSRLQPGVRSFSFETLGYESQVVETTLTAGGTARLDVVLATAPLAVEGLVVTSQKRQQAVQEVPITITVYDGEFLESTGIEEFDFLSSYTPGLEVQLQSPNNPGIVVRGITSDDGDARVQPRVSMYQDGVSISKARGAVVELFDLERVEVLKGPQGTLFGRAAEIGAVHLIQNKARNERSGEIEAGVGNYGGLHAAGYVNTPIVADRLFGRVAGVYSKRDGYVENLGGTDLNGKETLALRGLLRWAPSEFTDLDLILNWQQDTPPGVAFKSGVFAPAPRVGIEPGDPAFLGGDERFEDLFVDRTVWGATLLADHVLSPAWTLQAVGAFRRFDSYESFDADGSAAPALQFAEDAEGDQYSLELRTLFNSGGRFSGFAGVNVFHEDGEQGVLVRTDERVLFPLLTRVIWVQSDGEFPEIEAVSNGEPNFWAQLPPVIAFLGPILSPDDPDFFQGLVGAPLKPFHAETLINKGRTTAYEVFLDGTFAATDRLEITAGIRATYEDMWAGLEVPGADEPGVLGFFTGAYPNVLFPMTENGGTVGREETFSSWVGRVAADFAVSDDLNLFGTVAKGRRPNVIQEREANPVTDFEVLEEEVVWNYEVGAKGFALDRRVQWDIAGFYYDYRDFQTDIQPELTPDGVLFRTDLGEATAFGTELAVTGRATEALTVFGNYAFIDASFDELSRSGRPQELAGNTFRLTPKHSLSAGFGLSGRIAGANAFLRPSYTWKSRVYFEEAWQDDVLLDELRAGGVAPGLFQDAFGLLNVRTGAELLGGRASIEVWVNNVLDEEYIIDAGNTGLTFYAPTYIPGPPRMVGIRVTGRP